jgi:hypothetical protein
MSEDYIDEQFEKLKKAVKELYFAAYWHADRSVDEQKLWVTVRDAAEIRPGQTYQLLGPDQSLISGE